MIEILLPVIFVSFIIAGTHTYFGLHILKRGVIFADLAIAQMVAMGAAFAVLFDLNISLYSLIFGFLGAGLISLYRKYENTIIQEALIGVTYVSATAITIIFLEKAPHGEEALRTILSGNLLWVTYPQIFKTLIIYIAIFIIHGFLGKKFIELTEGKIKNLWLDMLFFFTFAITVTYAVQMGGILLVFSFLIIPSLISTFLLKSFIKRIFAGWLIGVIASTISAYLSYVFDIPTGPFIVVILTLLLIIVSIWAIFEKGEKREI